MRTETSQVQLGKLFSWEVTIALNLRLGDNQEQADLAFGRDSIESLGQFGDSCHLNTVL